MEDLYSGNIWSSIRIMAMIVHSECLNLYVSFPSYLQLPISA